MNKSITKKEMNALGNLWARIGSELIIVSLIELERCEAAELSATKAKKKP